MTRLSKRTERVKPDLPRSFGSLEEAARFAETNDVGEAGPPAELQLARGGTLTVRLESHVLRQLRREAMRRHTTDLSAGRYLVGCAYTLCESHDRLRLVAPPGWATKWIKRTPAMAAGLTDHRWTMAELLRYQIPPPAWLAPKRRGRPPKRPLTLVGALAPPAGLELAA